MKAQIEITVLRIKGVAVCHVKRIHLCLQAVTDVKCSIVYITGLQHAYLERLANAKTFVMSVITLLMISCISQKAWGFCFPSDLVSVQLLEFTQLKKKIAKKFQVFRGVSGYKPVPCQDSLLQWPLNMGKSMGWVCFLSSTATVKHQEDNSLSVHQDLQRLPQWFQTLGHQLFKEYLGTQGWNALGYS